MKNENSKKGFTLIEMLIVLVLISILNALSVPMYQKYIAEAIAIEGKILVKTIVNAEKFYFAEKSKFFTVSNPGTNNSNKLGIDARGNKFFQVYTVVKQFDENGTDFIRIQTQGLGGTFAQDIIVTCDFSHNLPLVITAKKGNMQL